MCFLTTLWSAVTKFEWSYLSTHALRWKQLFPDSESWIKLWLSNILPFTRPPGEKQTLKWGENPNLFLPLISGTEGENENSIL